MPLDFIVNGQKIEADELLKNAPKPKAKASDPKQEYHKGFFVEGFPPGHVAEAERVHKQNYTIWHAMREAVRAEQIKSGARDPGPWDESMWLRKHKPKRLSKLYGTPEAAQEFARVAESQGYTHVMPRAMAKGNL